MPPRYAVVGGGGGVPSMSTAPPRPWRTAVLWALGVAVAVAALTALSDSGHSKGNGMAAVHAGLRPVERDSEALLASAAPDARISEMVMPFAPPASALADAEGPADAGAALAAVATSALADDAEALPQAPAPMMFDDDAVDAEADAVPPAPPAPPAPAVAFLFLTINGEVVFPEVWKDFFAGAADDALFNVYVHRSAGDNAEITPAAASFLTACRERVHIVPTAPDTEWGQLIGAERSLAAGALAAPENTAFVYISHSTLPVKSFSHVYGTLIGRGASSSFCLTTQQAWVRSRVAPETVFPKHSQWITLSRPAAERFADLTRGDAVSAVNEACGGSWRQCYPATSEEIVMAAITGSVPAASMGSDWLATHPPPGGGGDNDLVTALRAEVEADTEDGAPANDFVDMPGVNGGAVPVRDIGATNVGLCDTWNWWDDFGADSRLEPAFRPFELLAQWAQEHAQDDGAVPAGGVEDILEQHVDRFWSPPYHPQELRQQAMTEEFLLEGLCASDALFARKFSFDFSLREAPLPRGADGQWACPASLEIGGDVWHAAPRARIDGVSCDGMRHAPIAGLNQHECRALCCAMGREQCTAWQYRGRWTPYHYCWVGHAGRCGTYGEAQAQLWRGERLLEGPPEPAQSSVADARRRVVDAFARCFARGAEAADESVSAAVPAPAPAEAEQELADTLPEAAPELEAAFVPGVEEDTAAPLDTPLPAATEDAYAAAAREPLVEALPDATFEGAVDPVESEPTMPLECDAEDVACQQALHAMRRP